MIMGVWLERGRGGRPGKCFLTRTWSLLTRLQGVVEGLGAGQYLVGACPTEKRERRGGWSLSVMDIPGPGERRHQQSPTEAW